MTTTKPKTQTKSDKVKQLLARAKGASLNEICEATNWQQHSVRSFLTGLRKKGFVVAREQRGEDASVYRITSRPSVEDARS